MRTPELHQKSLADKLAMGNQETKLKGTAGEYSDQCSCASNSDYKQFDEHWKSGIGAAVADVKHGTQSITDLLSCELRWSGINLPKVETQKILEI